MKILALLVFAGSLIACGPSEEDIQKYEAAKEWHESQIAACIDAGGIAVLTHWNMYKRRLERCDFPQAS